MQLYEKIGKESSRMKTHVFWDVMLCCWASTSCFKVLQCLHLERHIITEDKHSAASFLESQISHIQECSMPPIEMALMHDALILPTNTDTVNDHS
jgi:hypothetical protein